MSSVGHVLVVLVDLHPVWWGCSNSSLSHTIQSVLVLANSHLLQNPLNKLCVMGFTGAGVHTLYPCKLTEGDSVGGKYEGFDAINKGIMYAVKEIISECDDVTHHLSLDSSLLSGALIRALCYINQTTSNLPPGTSLDPRVLVIKGPPDCSSQYMTVMNSIFAAQKNKIPIDSCILGEDSGFLQQASDITGGTYLKVPSIESLTQYLLSVFVMSAEFRKNFNIPPPTQVDYRAACLCHQQMIDIGYVCSVCMSVFCKYRPICMTCNAHFKLPMMGTKKKTVIKRPAEGKT